MPALREQEFGNKFDHYSKKEHENICSCYSLYQEKIALSALPCLLATFLSHAITVTCTQKNKYVFAASGIIHRSMIGIPLGYS